MKDTRLADVRLGIFVVSAALLLIAGSLWLVGSSSIGGKRVSYQVLLQDSGGVQPGDRVRFAGVAVGRVQAIELRVDDPWPVRIDISVEADLPLRADGSAAMTSAGLLGTSFLQLLPGTPNAALLAPGDTIHGQSGGGIQDAVARVEALSEKAVVLIDQTTEAMAEITQQIGPVLTRLQSVLSEKNVEEISSLLESARRSMDEVGPRVGPLLERLDGVAEKLEEGLEDLPGLTSRASRLLDDLDAALGPDGNRLAGLLEMAEGSLGTAEDVLTMVQENRNELETTLQDLGAAAANFKAFSRQIKENPSSLVRKTQKSDRRPGEGVEENRR